MPLILHPFTWMHDQMFLHEQASLLVFKISSWTSMWLHTKHVGIMIKNSKSALHIIQKTCIQYIQALVTEVKCMKCSRKSQYDNIHTFTWYQHRHKHPASKGHGRISHNAYKSNGMKLLTTLFKVINKSC